MTLFGSVLVCIGWQNGSPWRALLIQLGLDMVPCPPFLYYLYSSDPNALGQHGPDHALIGGVVAVVVFVTLCLIIVLGRYLARHKGTYLTNEAKGADDAPDADTAIINADACPEYGCR
ncbi:hypothetical protein QTP86_007752 [Hemibagrus guttatus]|nr:hypothetical protein QTP86_007752 [Hemibagrus guttatus]